jgi:hypothetical protein
VEQGRRREGAAAVAELRRSRQRAGEHGPKKRARASVDHREAICIPGGVGDRMEGAVDDGVELGRRRRAAARGEGKSGGGKVGTGLD